MNRNFFILPVWIPSVLVAMAFSTNAALALGVKNVQFQEAGASTRIVMDLTAAPRDLEVKDVPGSKHMTVIFRGNLAGKPINRTYTQPNLQGVYIDNRDGKVQVFIKRNFVNTVAVNNKANQLVLDIPHRPAGMPLAGDSSSGATALSGVQEIAPGVRYSRFMQRTAQGPVQVSVLEVDPKNPALELTPVLAANKMGAKTNVATMVTSNQAVAGINGSFFKPDVGIPLGILIINQELISGPIYDRVAMGITHTNDVVMERVRLAGEVLLPDNRKVRLHNINQPRVNADHVVVYSSRWGTVAPKVPANGLQVQIRNNRVTAVSSTIPLPIPKDGVVISGPSTPEMRALATQYNARVPGPVQLSIYTLPDWSGMKHAIGGGPWLVKDGRVFIDLQAQNFTSKSLGFREPRSAVGVTRDGRILLVAVDGRQKNVSVGMTLQETAGLMHRLGAVHAMNLDGGSSTQMAIHGRIVNTPSAGNVGVSNSIIVRRSNGDNVALQDY